MKILIISLELWADYSNGGNVFSNIFSGVNATFAQVYCSQGIPHNSLCYQYLQGTDKSFVKSSLLHKTPWRSFYPASEMSLERSNCESKDGLKSFFSKFKTPFFYFSRDVSRCCSSWKNKDLIDFVKQFSPDLIFAPNYSSPFMLKLDRFCQKVAGVPMVSYISDDNYSLKQLDFSLFFWIHRFWIRKEIRKTMARCSLLYTMTDEQKNELQPIFHLPIKILRKSALMISEPHKFVFGRLSMIYAGGLYNGRWRTLLHLAKTVVQMKSDGLAAECTIDIFTSCSNKKIVSKLVKCGCRVHAAVDSERLFDEYRKHDIALHVESFSKRMALRNRLSFSTKITDCLSSGCAVLAICPDSNAGLKFLARNQAAICVTNKKSLCHAIVSLSNPNVLESYSENALSLIGNDFKEEDNRLRLQADLLSIMNAKNRP